MGGYLPEETGNKVNYGDRLFRRRETVTANTVDFWRFPMRRCLTTESGRLFQFPTVIGGVVLAVSYSRPQIRRTGAGW